MIMRLLLCLVLVCLVTEYSECGRFGGRSGGWSRGGGGGRSSGWSWGRSSRPSSSSTRHSYPSSSSGLSGSSGYNSHSYPSSSSGLSGSSGHNSHSYPSPSSGLSGSSGYGAHIYPSSSSGLSGSTGSGSHSYSSSTGLSGSSSYNSHSYPSSSSGLSGSSSTGFKPYYSHSLSGLSGAGIHSNDNRNIFSGTQAGGNKYMGQKPSYIGNNYNTPQKHVPSVYNTNTNPGHGFGSHGYNSPSYHSYAAAPQHVYITEYRNSDSRFSDILTGLALYNLGRSSNYHHHYYHDDYYTHRYGYSGSHHSSYDNPKDSAICTLKIKQENKIEALKIPCEIVSTFTDGSKKVSSDKEIQTVCESNYTIINNTVPVVNTTVINSTTPVLNTIETKNATLPYNFSEPKEVSLFNSNKTSESINLSTSDSNVSVIPLNTTRGPSPDELVTKVTNDILWGSGSISSLDSIISHLGTEKDISLTTNVSISSTTPQQEISTTMSTPASVSVPLSVISNITMKNFTKCNSTIDPLQGKDLSANATNLECQVKDTSVATNGSISLRTPQQDVVSTTTNTPVNVSVPISVISNITTRNSTKCISTIDPLKVKGAPVNAKNMECEVEIITKEARLVNKVDCQKLIEYSKKPEPPKKESAILPPKSQLKSWLSNPPWWLSVLIAV